MASGGLYLFNTHYHVYHWYNQLHLVHTYIKSVFSPSHLLRFAYFASFVSFPTFEIALNVLISKRIINSILIKTPKAGFEPGTRSIKMNQQISRLTYPLHHGASVVIKHWILPRQQNKLLPIFPKKSRKPFDNLSNTRIFKAVFEPKFKF